MDEHGRTLDNNRIEALKRLLRTRVAVLDGGLGTLFQSMTIEKDSFTLNENNHVDGDFDFLNLTRPDIVAQCHRQFLLVGNADIIETNTFNSSLIAQSHFFVDYQKHKNQFEELVYKMAKSGADIALSVAQEIEQHDESKHLRFVAGSVGPTGYSLALQNSKKSSGVQFGFSDFVKSYLVQMRALIDAHVDIVLIETVFDVLNCKAALIALSEAAKERSVGIPPVWISVTLTDSDRSLAGQSAEAFWHTVEPYNPMIFGFNCSYGAKKMCESFSSFMKRVSNRPCYFSLYPNKGVLGDQDSIGRDDHDSTPKEFAEKLKRLVEQRSVSIVGGCCGTSPQHIAELAKMVRESPPPAQPSVANECHQRIKLCGLDVMPDYDGVIIAGERCSVPGSRAFKQAVNNREWSTAVDIARQQLSVIDNKLKCSVLDICMDDSMTDGSDSIRQFLAECSGDSIIQRIPLIIDSSNMSVIETALQLIQGKPLVNSISLKEGEELFIECATICKKYGAAVVVMACDENGPALTAGDKIRVCKRAYDILTTVCNISEDDIVFDLNVMSIGTGIDSHANYAIEFLHALQRIKHELSPRIHTIAGISNVSFAFRTCTPVRRALNSVFLHETKGLLDIAIINPTMLQPLDSIPTDLLELCMDLTLNRRSDATTRMTDYCITIKRDSSNSLVSDSVKEKAITTEDLISDSVLKGNSKRLKDALELLISQHETKGCMNDVWDVINDPLMEAMKNVGDRFASGELFLPQVLKSAQTVQEAMESLNAHLSPAVDSFSDDVPVFILATVKGDVHDIGKNIVGTVVKSATNVRLIDLGTMCPTETIVDSVMKNKNVCAVGLSGLINPSLFEMGRVLVELQKCNCSVPVLIGGAATSALHTAIHLAPLYPNSHVIHVRDASSAVPVIRSLIGEPSIREDYLSKHSHEQGLLRMKFENAHHSLTESCVSLDFARAHRCESESDLALIPSPKHPGVHVVDDITVSQLVPRFNWKLFYHMYGVDKAGTEIQQAQLRTEALNCLELIESDESIKPRGVVGLFRASRTLDDDIEVTDDAGERFKFYFLRQQFGDKRQYYSLSDFVGEWIGVFAVTMGNELQCKYHCLQEENKTAAATLLHTVSLVLAECLSEAVHERVTKCLWVCGDIPSIRPAFGYPSQPDHTEKITAWNLLKVEENCGIKLTETCMMIPEASCSGLILCSPHAHYFSLGLLSQEQKQSYTRRKQNDSTFRDFSMNAFFPPSSSSLIR